MRNMDLGHINTWSSEHILRILGAKLTLTFVWWAGPDSGHLLPAAYTLHPFMFVLCPHETVEVHLKKKVLYSIEHE